LTSATVAFQTLGCKLNFSETSTLARKFVAAGYERVPFEMKADVYVINTCSVTENADKKFHCTCTSIRQRNPDAFLIAVGCYAQLQPEELAKEDSVDLVLGAKEKFDIISYLSDLSRPEQTQVHACAIEETDTYVGSYAIGERTRAFLKVQDGCDYKCTYCTIPQARGISRSDTLR
jgi:threonylcarbamoyladenosine tRNA methylthiotransferase MtaB